jgi:hypothetical protein
MTDISIPQEIIDHVADVEGVSEQVARYLLGVDTRVKLFRETTRDWRDFANKYLAGQRQQAIIDERDRVNRARRGSAWTLSGMRQG